MLDRFVQVLSEKLAKPHDSVTPDDMVAVDYSINALHITDMAADDNSRMRPVGADQFAHLPDLIDIGDDRTDAYYIVVVAADSLDEALQIGKVEQGAGGFDVFLYHQQTE